MRRTSALLISGVLLAGCAGAPGTAASDDRTAPAGMRLAEARGISFAVPEGWIEDPEAQEHGEDLAFLPAEEDDSQKVTLVVFDRDEAPLETAAGSQLAAELASLPQSQVRSSAARSVPGAEAALERAIAVGSTGPTDPPETRYDLYLRTSDVDALVRVTSRTPLEDKALAERVLGSVAAR